MKQGDKDYKTELSSDREKAFREWYAEIAGQYGLSADPDDPLHFYDWRGYWDELQGMSLLERAKASRKLRSTGHFPDTYKTPGHPTFSTESKYYKYGMYAGTWKDGKYIIPQPEYDIYTDGRSFAARDKHLASLDKFIKANPTIAGINTADFRAFLSAVAGRESAYRNNSGAGKAHSGWYGLRGGRDLTDEQQHRKAYEHLANLFKNDIVLDADVEAGKARGYTPAQILYKYWNQNDNATEYFHNGVAETLGENDDIRMIGNNITVDLDYSPYLHHAVSEDYHVIQPGDSFEKLQRRVRVPGRHYNQNGDDLVEYNNGKNGIFQKDKNGKWRVRTLRPQRDTVWFVPHSDGGNLQRLATRLIEVGYYKDGGKIHIDPSKKGTFTAAAKKHGKSVQSFASQVLAHKENYSPAMVKKANFARNAAKWHAEGGYIDRLLSVYGNKSNALEVIRRLRISK